MKLWPTAYKQAVCRKLLRDSLCNDQNEIQKRVLLNLIFFEELQKGIVNIRTFLISDNRLEYGVYLASVFPLLMVSSHFLTPSPLAFIP